MQDRSITQIGRYALSQQAEQEPYMLFIQNLQPKHDFQMLLADFELIKNEEGEWMANYTGIDFQRVGQGNFKSFAYRKGSPRGGDITFTTKFGDPAKKLSSIRQNLFPKAISLAQKNKWHEESFQLKAMEAELKQQEDKIIEELNEAFNGLGDKNEQNRAGFSIRASINGSVKMAGDWQSMQALLIASGTEGNATKYNVTSKSENQLCSVCVSSRDLIYGFGSPFKYATVDKPGMVSGFFRQENNWKNYPICSECTLELEMGSLYMQQNLRRSFYGASYFMVPQLVLARQDKELAKILRELDNLYEADKSVPINMREDQVMRRVGKLEDYFMLNLLFFEENPTTKAIRIQLQLNEIFPSRFRKLFQEVPETIEKHSLFKKSYREKKELKDLKFYFGLLKDFFGSDFHGIVQKAFLGHPLEEAVVYKSFMDRIREHYRKSKANNSGYVEPVPLTVLKAHMVLAYLSHLGIIAVKPITIMEEQLMEETELPQEQERAGFSFPLLKEYFDKQQEFFNSPGKQGVFALGVLVKLVMNLQYRGLGSTPFEKKLKGYQLNLNDLQHIYVEAISLLKKYLKANNMQPEAYHDLREFTAEFFAVQNHTLQSLNNNELAFYLVSGLELTKRFYQSKNNQPK